MNWYTWSTEAAFDAWHATVVDGLGMPWIGQNQATGEPEPNNQHTTAYTAVTEVAADDWRAVVGDDIVAGYADGLGALSEAPPEPEELP
jgi:hypothetical protein